MHVLQLDIIGTPQGFVTVEDATLSYATGAVAWTVGDPLVTMRGGTNARTGMQSTLDVHPIIALRGQSRVNLHDYVPVLNNRKLFERDRCRCVWCGNVFRFEDLTREHITPVSRGGACGGGAAEWLNTAAACRGCNTRKGSKLPQELGWQLVYMPYVPSLFEDMLLQGRRIRADVHEWLATNPKTPRR